MTQPVSDSRLALYEGLISLAWADERLDTSERLVLEDIFAQHAGLSDEQRVTLVRDVDRPRPLADIWPRMTDIQDRARFLDMADVIFKSDGEVAEAETDLYAVKLAKHLGTLDLDRITRDLDQLRIDISEQNKKEAETYRDYAKNFGLFAYLKKLVSFDGDRREAARAGGVSGSVGGESALRIDFDARPHRRCQCDPLDEGAFCA